MQIRILLFVPGHLDYEEVFVVDDKNPEKVIDYTLTETSGSIKLKNIFSDSYIVMVKGNGETKTFFSVNLINLPAGEFEVDINIGGFILSKKITVKFRKRFTIDFEEEIKNM